jgi:hypothetical protein
MVSLLMQSVSVEYFKYYLEVSRGLVPGSVVEGVYLALFAIYPSADPTIG